MRDGPRAGDDGLATDGRADRPGAGRAAARDVSPTEWLNVERVDPDEPFALHVHPGCGWAVLAAVLAAVLTMRGCL